MRVLSTVMLLTIAMVFVWVRSSQTTAQRSVHHTSNDGPVGRDHGLMLVSNTTQVTLEQERVWNATPVAIQEPDGEQAPIHHPRAEHLRVTSRSRNDGSDVAVQDNQFKTRPSISENRAPMFVIQRKLIKKMPHSIYYHRGNTSTVVDENFNNESDASQVLHKTNIRLNHRQINNYSHPTIQIDKTAANTGIINNNQSAYDLTYDRNNEEGSEENKNSIHRSGWTTFFNTSRQILPGELWLLETPEIINGSSDQPPFKLRARYQNKKNMEYMFKQYDANRNPNIPERQLLKHIPPTYEIDFNAHPILDTRQDSSILQPSEGIPALQNNPSTSSQSTVKEVPIINEILWRRIGLMALIKLGLVKLKVIGFIKILYLLLFKLKFVLIVLFLKFFSLLKFIKLSSLPLFFLPLAAIIFLMTTKTFPAFTSLILDINNNPGISSTAGTPIPNINQVTNSLGETIKVIEEIVSTPVETVVVPSSQTIVVPPVQPAVVPPVQPAVVPPVQTLVVPDPNIPPDVIDAFLNLGMRYEPLEVMDPTLDLFQTELNSEKCVERIACKIAATGKTGIVPLWINWVLHRGSNPVPNDKLLNYLKAYDDVINEIHLKSPNPDNWETWCYERYDCNDTDTK